VKTRIATEHNNKAITVLIKLRKNKIFEGDYHND